jgi:segregation and condensation protein A
MEETKSEMSLSSYTVKMDTFEGPLDLLLSLIEKRKFLINDVSLTKVADDFIAYLEEQSDFPIGETADFLFVASTLLLLKSKSLLPILEFTEEEKESIEDLEDRLKLHQQFRDLGRELQVQFGQNISYSRSRVDKSVASVFSPHPRITLAVLSERIMDIVNSLPQALAPMAEAMVKRVMSLEDMIERLAERMKGALQLSFKEFSKDKKERAEIIVGFLAMLELVKQGMIRVEQESREGDILMESESVGMPQY